MTASLPTIRLQTGRQRRVPLGHPWVYSNEVQMDQAAKALPAGTLVRLVDPHGTAMGIASFTPHTLIAARILDRDPAASIDEDWMAARIGRALAVRDSLFDRPFYRLIHAEADGLPATIVDRYGDILVVQANTAGIYGGGGIRVVHLNAHHRRNWCPALEHFRQVRMHRMIRAGARHCLEKRRAERRRR